MQTGSAWSDKNITLIHRPPFLKHGTTFGKHRLLGVFGVRIVNGNPLLEVSFQKALLAGGKRGMEKCESPCLAFSRKSSWDALQVCESHFFPHSF